MKEHLFARDLLTLSAAGILNPAEERRVQEHVAGCDLCRAEFNEWAQIAGALNAIPTTPAPPRLVAATQRLLFHAAYARRRQISRLGLAMLIVFSWMVAFMTLRFVHMLDMPIAEWLEISSGTVWFLYIGISWFATALAAGLLGKHWLQEGRSI